jgi:hypothetical protein
VSDDTFADVAALIALVVDAKSCAKRLDELRRATQEAETARAALEAARVANQTAISEAHADLDKRRARTAEGEIELRLKREAQNPVAPVPDAAEKYPFNPNFPPGSRSHTGLAREKHHE